MLISLGCDILHSLAESLSGYVLAVLTHCSVQIVTWKPVPCCELSSSLSKSSCNSAWGLPASPEGLGDVSWEGVGVTSRSSIHSASSAKPPKPLSLPCNPLLARPDCPSQTATSLSLLVSASDRPARWSAMVLLFASLDLLRAPAAAVSAAAASLIASRPNCKFAMCS